MKFHDGKPFTSADVQFTIMEVLKKVHPRGINTFRDVTAVETPDDPPRYSSSPTPRPTCWPRCRATKARCCPSTSSARATSAPITNANQPIGTGPFKFVEWRRGELVRLDKNPDYWRKGLPYLDRIVVRFINDEATRTAALEKGEAHVAGFGARALQRRQEAGGRCPRIEVTTKGYEMISPVVELVINTKKAPFDNQKVRQAMAYAIDRQFIIDNIWFGFGKPATGPMSSNFAPSGLYTADVTKYQVPDGIEKANKLLDEAGFPKKDGGIRFEIVHDITPYGPEWQRFGEVVQQQLAPSASRRRCATRTWRLGSSASIPTTISS